MALVYSRNVFLTETSNLILTVRATLIQGKHFVKWPELVNTVNT